MDFKKRKGNVYSEKNAELEIDHLLNILYQILSTYSAFVASFQLKHVDNTSIQLW